VNTKRVMTLSLDEKTRTLSRVVWVIGAPTYEHCICSTTVRPWTDDYDKRSAVTEAMVRLRQSEMAE
jgi:hypothetical protein